MLNSCNRDIDQFLTKKYDEKFAQIPNLTWYPWVGKDYDSYRRLIVGESNYVNKEILNETKHAALKRAADDKDFERKVVDCLGCCGGQRNKTMDALVKMLSQEPIIRFDLWRRVAMMELLQQPIIGSGWGNKCKSKKLSTTQLNRGVNVVISVMAILKPEQVMFVGKSVLRAFQKQNVVKVLEEGRKEFFQSTKCLRKSSISYGCIAMNSEYNIKYVAVAHPGGSYGFNVDKWHKELNELKEQGFVVCKDKDNK